MSTPLRVNDALFNEAEIEGSLMNRSAAKQVEFWARLGKNVANSVSPIELISLLQGIADIEVKVTAPARVEPGQVFNTVEQARASGSLGKQITQTRLYYEASQTHAGLLDQVSPDGRRQAGHFRDGEFIAA